MPVEDEHGNKVKLNINEIKTVDKTDMERIKIITLDGDCIW